MAVEPTREFEFQQHHAHDRRTRFGKPDQIVEPDRRGPEQRNDAGARIGIRRAAKRRLLSRLGLRDR